MTLICPSVRLVSGGPYYGESRPLFSLGNLKSQVRDVYEGATPMDSKETKHYLNNCLLFVEMVWGFEGLGGPSTPQQ